MLHGEYGVEGAVGALGIPYGAKAGVFGPGEKTKDSAILPRREGRRTDPDETLEKDGKRFGTAGGGPDGGMLGGSWDAHA